MNILKEILNIFKHKHERVLGWENGKIGDNLVFVKSNFKKLDDLPLN